MGRRRGHPGAKTRWTYTVVATAVSTWMLDSFAALAGVVLVASDVLAGTPRVPVLGILAATYVAWAAGLRANIAANWCLLDQTGTSTNAMSKLGFDLARLRSKSERTVWAASAVGYVVTEIAKEAPYYAGAFGTALASDAVDSTDALIFLAGTNVGAAFFEYGVARLTRSYLRRRRVVAQWAREGNQETTPHACVTDPMS